MIINENNKNTILKGMVKRGFNQNPNELKEKLQANNRMLNNFNTSPKINTDNNPVPVRICSVCRCGHRKFGKYSLVRILYDLCIINTHSLYQDTHKLPLLDFTGWSKPSFVFWGIKLNFCPVGIEPA